MILPERLVRRAETFAQNLFICPPALAQVAACAALQERELFERIKADYAVNRKRLLQTQERLGLTGGPSADGAFYLYWPVDTLLKPGEDSLGFCKALLEETGIAITPGVDFDPVDGGRYVRVSFAGSTDTIAQAADLFEDWARARGAVG